MTNAIAERVNVKCQPLPAILNYSITSRRVQLDGLEDLLDKFVEYKDTDASLHFYELLEAAYERVCYEGRVERVTVLCY